MGTFHWIVETFLNHRVLSEHREPFWTIGKLSASLERNLFESQGPLWTIRSFWTTRNLSDLSKNSLNHLLNNRELFEPPRTFLYKTKPLNHRGPFWTTGNFFVSPETFFESPGPFWTSGNLSVSPEIFWNHREHSEPFWIIGNLSEPPVIFLNHQEPFRTTGNLSKPSGTNSLNCFSNLQSIDDRQHQVLCLFPLNRPVRWSVIDFGLGKTNLCFLYSVNYLLLLCFPSMATNWSLPISFTSIYLPRWRNESFNSFLFSLIVIPCLFSWFQW
jgi:hypothetical protein